MGRAAEKKQKRRDKSLFEQAYSITGDGVAVLKVKRAKSIPQFTESIQKIKRYRSDFLESKSTDS